MKLLSYCLALLFCSNLSAQSINQEIDSSKPYLVGKINKEGLQSGAYAQWFEKNYNNHKPDPTTTEALQESLSDYTIKAFLGTWCGDSKREVPRLYAVLDAANFPLQRLTTVALDKQAKVYRQSPGGEQEALNVFRVPTIIVFKDGKEVNRIIERPKVSIEDDLLAIVNGNYQPNYQGETLVIKRMEEWGLDRFAKRQKKIAKEVAPMIKRYYGLQTLAKVQYAAGKQEEAIEITRLNTQLFPEEKGPKLLLAKYREADGDLVGAKELYNQVLEIEADNSTAKQALKRMETK